MLESILDILYIVGVLLLILAVLLLLVLLLVLFFPVSYRVSGEKSAENLKLRCRGHWLFGLVRMDYHYPEPGKVLVKCLFFTIYDSSRSKKTDSKEKASEAKTASPKGEAAAEKDRGEVSSDDTPPAAPDRTEPVKDKSAGSKRTKLKYTIQKVCDKIKYIWENITFYKDLFDQEDTRALFQHLGKRFQNIWKNIHPRKLQAKLLFGTGAPDTTGYCMALYGVLYPWLGADVALTPDFEQALFQGEFYAAGHITVFQVLFHSLMFVMDKHFREFLQKVKNFHSNEHVSSGVTAAQHNAETE